MPKEDVYFYGVANIIEKTVTDDELHKANRLNREAWKHACAGGIQLHAVGVNYTPERCFDLVVNGELFHDDADKAAEFERLDAISRDFVHARANGLVIQALKILHVERNVINSAFERGVVTAEAAPS